MTQSTIDSIKIVKYHEGLAKSIADMWNESREGWGGDASIMTEEQVIEKEANSEDLFLYLALDNEKVVGYCGISEYKEDVKALYIRLLNVHPDYQGKKIGKQLVLKAVEKTVELGWPRIDLYTWAGNVKAVPLYKKCGFFWEDRDETTHLMNFIPLVLQNELLKPYFQHLDWYKDNKRVIEVKPDGTKENGFTFFEYIWQNEQYYVRVQIEKSGRGIRLIETNDYLLEIKMDSHSKIEGRDANLQVFVKNKTNEALTIDVNGLQNERIHVHATYKQVNVKEQYHIDIPVSIYDGSEPNEWVTHPKAELNIQMNGLRSIMALGTYPKKAMKLKWVYHPKKFETNKRQICYLEIDNQLKQNAEISLELPENSWLEWTEPIITNSVEEIGLLEVPFLINKYGFIQAECKVTVKTEDETFEWSEPVAFSLPNFGVKACGYDKEYYYLQNGYYKLRIRKRDNAMTVGSEENLIQRTVMFPPKFGKPYIGELSKKEASHFDWNQDEQKSTLKLFYEISKPSKLKLIACFELYGEGLLKYWLEIENGSQDELHELYVYQPIRHELNQTYVPLNNNIIYFNDAKMTDLSQLNSNEVSENWIFSEDLNEPHGLSWSKNAKIGFDGWLLYVEEKIETLQVKGKIRTSPIHIAVGAIKSVEDFQFFATGLRETMLINKEVNLSTPTTNLVLADQDKMAVQLKRIQNRYFHGTLSIEEGQEIIHQMEIHQENNQDIQLEIPTKKKAFTPIHYSLASDSQQIQGSMLFIQQDQTKIQLTKEEEQSIYKLTNGDLTIRASTRFFPTLYSIKYKDQEWLDSSFPVPEPKAWWNPWGGGVQSSLNGISLFSWLKEQSYTTFVKKTDQHGNVWEGLAIHTNFEKHEKWKGLRSIQYYLTLPGVPIIVHFTELAHLHRSIHESLYTEFWLKKGSINHTMAQLVDTKGSQWFKAGSEEHIFRSSNPYLVSNHDQTEWMQVFSANSKADSECIFSEEFALAATISHLNINPGEDHRTEPIFMLFPGTPIEKEAIESLKTIKF
ncbi:GNAT family N-acetyltransferase [Heyndrickxia sp. FSL W8-0496]|uniref:GNAT family N-acetyltransferase n=1 Tax=Heyndrickxia TaxID=2837504 RepID=UPI0030F5E292